jgi:phosphocarrier protein FPr
LRKAVESGLGDVVEALPVAPVAAVSSSGEPVAVSGGLVIGTLSFASTGQVAVPEHRIEDVEKELQRLHGAIEKARTALAAEQAALKSSAGTSEAEILAAQELILDDPELLRRAETGIGDRHENAAAAWAHAYQAAAAGYDELQDEYLRQRAADVRDIGARVLSALGVAWARVGDLAEPGILVVDDLTPAEVMALPATVRGVICLGGGRTSHAAILLRARGLPAIAQARRAFERAKIERPPGEITAAFDGDTGELWIDPESSRLQALRVQEEKRRVAAEEAVRLSHEPAVTADGQTIPIFANLGHAGEAPAALESGAEGVGLFRTEFLFLERATPPGEEEQFAALRQLGESMDTRPVTIRTLDVGGDKDLPYLGLAREANPFLGERGLRLCLQRPELFQAQLRAILRAGHGRDFRIMFPMVTELAELRAARAALDEAHQALAKSGTPHVWPISTGIMAEVPAAAILSDQLAAEADFFSIGTNDLTQYVLAADRAHSTLAHFQDALHPAVLRVIAQITAAARAHGRHVGVCGEAASDPAAAGLFVGLGVDDLSLGVGQLPMVKAVLRAVRRSDLETLAARALEMASAGEVRAMVRKRASLDKTAMKSPP